MTLGCKDISIKKIRVGGKDSIPLAFSFCLDCNMGLFLIFVKKQSQELTRVNPDRNIFSINVELTSTFFTLQRFGPSPSLNFKS